MGERYIIERKVSGQPFDTVDVLDGWEDTKSRLLEALDEYATGRVTAVAAAAYMQAYRIVDERWPNECHPTPTVDGGNSWAIEVNGAVRYIVRMLPAIDAPEPPAVVVPHLHDALDALRRLAEAGDPTAVVVLHIYEGDTL